VAAIASPVIPFVHVAAVLSGALVPSAFPHIGKALIILYLINNYICIYKFQLIF